VTLADVSAIYDHWQTRPPVHVLIAAYFGHKGQRRERAKLVRGIEAQQYAPVVEDLIKFFDSAGQMFH
jgi:hypothetical protein